MCKCLVNVQMCKCANGRLCTRVHAVIKTLNHLHICTFSHLHISQALAYSHISTLRNMLVLILSLIVLCVIAAIAGWLRNRSLQRQLERGEINEMPHIKKRPEGCCGKHAVCEKDEMAAALAQPIEYFDDEELDSFKGRPSDSYTPQEVEQFEEVMTTMQPQEVAAWLRSLQLRSVNLPDDLKDEAMLLMAE